jgi:lipid-binding SYLF domain-containing protein
VETESAKVPIIGFVRTNRGFKANLSLDGTRSKR